MMNALTVFIGIGLLSLVLIVSATGPLGLGAQPTACKKGLCPYIKKLVPDLTTHPAMSHYIPYVHGYEPPSLCGNLCADDIHCPDHKKCCPTNCGYACFDAIHVANLPSEFIHHRDSHPDHLINGST